MGFAEFIEKTLVQTAVYWGNPVADGYGGYTYDAPIEIDCRWQSKKERIAVQQGTSANSEEDISNAQIYVKQDLNEGAFLYLGTLAEFIGGSTTWNDGGVWDDARIWAETPEVVGGSFKIKKFEKSALLKSTTDYIRKAYL